MNSWVDDFQKRRGGGGMKWFPVSLDNFWCLLLPILVRKFVTLIERWPIMALKETTHLVMFRIPITMND